MRGLLVLAVCTAGCAQFFGLDNPGRASSDGGHGDGQGDGQTRMDAKIPGCPSGFVTIVGGDHLYRELTTKMSWDEQRRECQALSPNAYLAVPDTDTEQAGIDAIVT